MNKIKSYSILELNAYYDILNKLLVVYQNSMNAEMTSSKRETYGTLLKKREIVEDEIMNRINDL